MQDRYVGYMYGLARALARSSLLRLLHWVAARWLLCSVSAGLICRAFYHVEGAVVVAALAAPIDEAIFAELHCS